MKIPISFDQLKRLKISKHRNSKSKSVKFTDLAGNDIKGHPVRHFLQVANKQQNRYTKLLDEFSKMSLEEQRELYSTIEALKGNLNKAALIEAFYKALLSYYKTLELDYLKSLTNLPKIDEEAVKMAIKELETIKTEV